ncbi:hypothetical protein BVU76_03995 [Mycolicibacterium porcinum]|nr:hypothetical protein BVU76_03995 [Mycolicibacterium porcinum]
MKKAGLGRRGRIVRAAPLVAMSSRTAGEVVVSSLRRKLGVASETDVHDKAAQRYADYLGQSKGLLMKVGQILSYTMLGGALGDGNGAYQRALTRLQSDAPPMPTATAISIIELELGAPLYELFAEFDATPVGAASIGQVHRAVTADGREVAVKVQYPGVDEAIRSDLENTDLLATFLDIASSAVPGLVNTDVSALTDEVAQRVTEELDYRIERANQQAFLDAYEGHPFIRIPAVVEDLCSQRVLTQDFVRGRDWRSAQQAAQPLRDAWGEAIYRFSIGSVRRFGLFNADPHPGNYLFHDDGGVTFLDFGCVKSFTPDLVGAMQDVMSAAVAGDGHALLQGLHRSGSVDHPAQIDHSAALRWFCSGLQLLTAPQPYQFAPDEVDVAVREKFSMTGPHGHVLRQLRLPPDALTIMRIELGMYSILAGLRARGMWEAIRREWDHHEAPITAMGRSEQHLWRKGAV